MKKYIENIKNLLNLDVRETELEELEEDFLAYLKADADELKTYDKDQINQFEGIIKRLLKEVKDKKINNHNIKNFLNEIFKSEDLKTLLSKFLEEKVDHYMSCEVLRNIGNTNPKQAKKLVHFLFLNSILRSSNLSIEDLRPYGITSVDAYDTLVKYLKKLILYCTKTNLSEKDTTKLLYSIFELDIELCKELAKLIEKNLLELKVNYIMKVLVQNKNL